MHWGCSHRPLRHVLRICIRPGSPLMHPPLALDKARLYGFWGARRSDRIASQCRSHAQRVQPRRNPFHRIDSLRAAELRGDQSRTHAYPMDVVKGWGKEIDIVTWVMVGATKPGEEWPTFYAYPLHIWVDDCMRWINGRELYGYPKFDCLYGMPEPDQPPTTFRSRCERVSALFAGNRIGDASVARSERDGWRDG